MATVKKVFKARIPSVNYIFKNGKPAIFIAGRFLTDIPAEIKELEEEIALGHPHIYVDDNEETVEAADPGELMMGLREKFFKEFQEAHQRALNPDNDMGSTDQVPLNPASSTDVATAAAGGDGSAGAKTISLANLRDRLGSVGQ